MYEIPAKNMTLVVLNKFITSEIQPIIQSGIIKYGLSDNKITHPDVKRLIYHHIIYEVCERQLKHDKHSKLVFVYNTNTSHRGVLDEHFTFEAMNVFVNRLVKKLSTLLPIKICVLPVDVDLIDTQKDIDVFNLITNACYQKSKDLRSHTHTFEKVKKFIKANQLTFLTVDYFKRIETNQLFI